MIRAIKAFIINLQISPNLRILSEQTIFSSIPGYKQIQSKNCLKDLLNRIKLLYIKFYYALSTTKEWHICQVVVAHSFNSRTQKAEVGGSLGV